jgi:hypothetical protein
MSTRFGAARWKRTDRLQEIRIITELINEMTNVTETILVLAGSEKSEIVQWQTDWTAGSGTKFYIYH